ncbi:30S ribosomal protein S1 [bacterium]|nr:30S ribosomal protein S1 [bacterium]
MSKSKSSRLGGVLGTPMIDENARIIASEGDTTLESESRYSDDEFEKLLAMYDSTFRRLDEKSIIKAKVLAVTLNEVIVDIGFKSEGIIPKEEFNEEVQVGDEIDVYLEELEDKEGQVVISKTKANFTKTWEKVQEAYEKNMLMKGMIKRRVKGGMMVELDSSIEAFLPGSQIALRPIRDFDDLLDTEMEFKIIKLSRLRQNIVISRRVVLEDQRAQRRADLIDELSEGSVCDGIVKNITDFGVFVDLGGLDGLLHITDLSWSKINHPSEVVNMGDKIKVKVLSFDKDQERVSLGMKQLEPSPWEIIAEKYPPDSKVKGKVVNITRYGAFVELEEGVEGLIHISELSWTKHIEHPSQVLTVGEEIEVLLTDVSVNEQKISLSLKRLKPDPWSELEKIYPVGSKVTGTVTNITSFGVFVEIEEGIDGLIHISDLSWTKRVLHPSEMIKRRQKIDVVVLDIDKENKRISLGYKQLEKDPWPDLARRYGVGQETEGRIVKLMERGVIVELPSKVEGFVPVTQLGKKINKPSEAFSEGDILPLKIIEFDEKDRRIVLSVNAYFESRKEADLARYLAQHPTKLIKVEELATRPNILEDFKRRIEEKSAEGEESESESGETEEIADEDSDVETAEDSEDITEEAEEEVEEEITEEVTEDDESEKPEEEPEQEPEEEEPVKEPEEETIADETPDETGEEEDTEEIPADEDQGEESDETAEDSKKEEE